MDPIRHISEPPVFVLRKWIQNHYPIKSVLLGPWKWIMFTEPDIV